MAQLVAAAGLNGTSDFSYAQQKIFKKREKKKRIFRWPVFLFLVEKASSRSLESVELWEEIETPTQATAPHNI